MASRTISHGGSAARPASMEANEIRLILAISRPRVSSTSVTQARRAKGIARSTGMCMPAAMLPVPTMPTDAQVIGALAALLRPDAQPYELRKDHRSHESVARGPTEAEPGDHRAANRKGKRKSQALTRGTARICESQDNRR